MSRHMIFARIRRGLDFLYDFCGALSALCLVGILLVIVAQMVARWSSFTFPGATEYAGYLMAAASFLAFAHALNHGSHIRVTILLEGLGKYRRIGELWCFGVGTVAATYLSWHACKLVYWSRKLKDVSQGQDATPLWIVQLPVAIGAVLLAIAMWDNLLNLLVRDQHNIREDASAGAE